MTRYREIIGSVFFVVFSLFYIIFSFSIPVRPGTNSRLVPHLAGGTILGLSLINFVICVVKQRKNPPAAVTGNREEKPASDYKKVLLTLILLSMYVIGLSTLGFLISTFVFLSAQIFLFAPKEKRKPLPILLPSAICTVVIYYLFRHVFSVSLPYGMF